MGSLQWNAPTTWFLYTSKETKDIQNQPLKSRGGAKTKAWIICVLLLQKSIDRWAHGSIDREATDKLFMNMLHHPIELREGALLLYTPSLH